MSAAGANVGRWLSALAAGWILLALMVVPFLQGGGGEVAGSVASFAPDGRRALRLLLQESGWRTLAWRAVPRELPDGGALLWWADVPADGLAAQDASPQRDPSFYREFVERGGRIVLALDEERVERLGQSFGWPELEDLALVPLRGSLNARADDGARLVLDWNGFALAGGTRELEPFLETDAGEVLGAVQPLGKGAFILLGDDGYLQNDSIGRLDHALAAVRWAERWAPDRPIYFDEYAVGRWQPQSVVAFALSGRGRWPLAHAAVLALLCVWRLSWRREFPRDPEPLEQLSPRSRAEARAALLTRARRFEVLADMLRRGSLRVAAERWHCALADGSIAEELDQLARRIGAPGAIGLWRELFVHRAVSSASELDELARDLSDWEQICSPGKLRPAGDSSARLLERPLGLNPR